MASKASKVVEETEEDEEVEVVSKKKRDPERTNGKPKVTKTPKLPKVGEYKFNGEDNREAAEKFFAHLKTVHSDDPGFQALVDFANWSRDAVGWRSFGRVVTTGKAER